jgi:hypothetical protein
VKFRNLIIAAALALTAGTAAAVMSGTPALAIPNAGNNWCLSTTPYCWNAWGGGPWVQQYTGGANQANGDFIWDHGTYIPAQYLFFSNQGSNWYGNCIGDAYNNPNDARASLNPCPGVNGGNGNGDGWGTHWVRDTGDCPNGQVAFKNVHWNGWLGPDVVGVNGSLFYLNKPNPYCFTAYPPI